MALIEMRDICWGFGDPPLLENINFQIEKGERVGLLGRNGVGKTSIIKLLGDKLRPDSGTIRRQQGIIIASLEQDVSSKFVGTIFDVIAEGLGKKGRALAEYNRICKIPTSAITPELSKKRDELQQILNAGEGWGLLQQVEHILSRTNLDPEKKFADLSAGLKRRTLFARALALSPDILLLDEPTNHFDIDSIIWMEDFILRQVKTLLFITHDRAFLKKIATRMIELDRCRLVSYDCDYGSYLARRAATLKAEEQQAKLFDKKLSKEEIWIRQGIKARRTRNEGRVRVLKKMRANYQARRKKTGNVKLQAQEAEKTGKLVIEAKNISFSHDRTPLITDFSTTIMRGDKVGIIGPNGIGKTTLLKILLNRMPPKKGSISHGTHLQMAYFDQMRTQLKEQKTVQENIAEGNDFIIFNDQKRHVIGYLKDFLFSPERCRTPVHILSGGEKNRLMLAKLFTKPANLLVLDEPTNDLDAETLELLEELLFTFQGTILLVSHDRAFLNNVVTSTIVFEGRGRVIEYVGGYDDWLIQRQKPVEKSVPAKKNHPQISKKPESGKPQKMSYMQKRELDQLPQMINTLETEQKDLYELMSDPLFYKKDKEKIAAAKDRLEKVEHEIETAYLRWEAIE
ncbi:MAG: ATP-binding cassette domain-containing protein [Deltaproteobacteria bacterium]|nr:ATP-binding cassette domain-containing protein [Deltaproteobacteria bacterium]